MFAPTKGRVEKEGRDAQIFTLEATANSGTLEPVVGTECYDDLKLFDTSKRFTKSLFCDFCI